MDGLFTMPSRTSQKYDSIAASVMTLADEMYGLLARTFPVCCYSDEFYFFPQVVVDEILAEMTEERESLLVELSTLGEELKPGVSLMDAYNGIPQVPIPREGKSKLLFQEIERLRGHCLELGLLPRDLAEGCPVKIRAVPQSMTPVRAADSYSALPGL